VDDARRKIESYKSPDKPDTIFDYLMEDKSDGYYFIDYLKPIGCKSDLPKIQIEKERKSIQNFIKQNIESHRDNDEIYEKYKWLHDYFAISDVYFQ
jgi:hypothetical protein